MEADFKIIVITQPDFIADEPIMIERLLKNGVDYVHLRKPEASLSATENLINRIDKKFHHRLKLHDYFMLASKHGLGGIHLNSRNPFMPSGWEGNVTKSCHSLEELDGIDKFEYITLSPVFDSISKEGYKGRFNAENIKHHLEGRTVVALGGVRLGHIPLLKELGFSGAALVGDIWQNPENELWK